MPRPRRGGRSRRLAASDTRRSWTGTGTGRRAVVLKKAPTTAAAPPRWPFSRARRVRTSARSAPVGREASGRRRGRVTRRARGFAESAGRGVGGQYERQRRLQRLPPFSSSPDATDHACLALWLERSALALADARARWEPREAAEAATEPRRRRRRRRAPRSGRAAGTRPLGGGGGAIIARRAQRPSSPRAARRVNRGVPAKRADARKTFDAASRLTPEEQGAPGRKF